MAGYAIEDPTYQPSMRLITDITNAVTPTFTTSFDHGYSTGLIVRIKVPALRFGMTQIDQFVGVITVTGDDTFTMDIDTTNFNAFTIPDPEEAFTAVFPEVVPVGEQNSILTQAVRNVL